MWEEKNENETQMLEETIHTESDTGQSNFTNQSNLRVRSMTVDRNSIFNT